MRHAPKDARNRGSFTGLGINERPREGFEEKKSGRKRPEKIGGGGRPSFRNHDRLGEQMNKVDGPVEKSREGWERAGR